MFRSLCCVIPWFWFLLQELVGRHLYTWYSWKTLLSRRQFHGFSTSRGVFKPQDWRLYQGPTGPKGPQGPQGVTAGPAFSPFGKSANTEIIIEYITLLCYKIQALYKHYQTNIWDWHMITWWPSSFGATVVLAWILQWIPHSRLRNNFINLHLSLRPSL